MLIHSVKLKNFLSFGNDSEKVELKSLNIIIGPNGSGKSNFLESIELLKSTPRDLRQAFTGITSDWLWKGSNGTPTAQLDFVLSNPVGTSNLHYMLSLTVVNNRLEIVDERIENEQPADEPPAAPYFYYHYNDGRPTLNINGNKRFLKKEDIDTGQSILSQRRDPDQYPEITHLGMKLETIRLFREWSFGRYTMPRLPQKADLPARFLESDASNLGLVLNNLRRYPDIKMRFLKALQVLYKGIDDYDVHIEGGTVQVFFQEGKFTVPATRLSDGTLRYLCLLAILFHPDPPPLICIEEPELGLHPDVLPKLAELLKEASERCQLIVTTHSDILVDAMSDDPESVLICEKENASTKLVRLSAEELRPWLQEYRLGELWLRGEIGGIRW